MLQPVLEVKMPLTSKTLCDNHTVTVDSQFRTKGLQCEP